MENSTLAIVITIIVVVLGDNESDLYSDIQFVLLC
jgi:hypothetical protein